MINKRLMFRYHDRQKEKIIHILHNYGGGTETCVDYITEIFNNYDHIKIKIINEFDVSINDKLYKSFNLNNYITKFKIKFMIVHHLLYWNSNHVLNWQLANQITNSNIKKFFHVHDFHLLYPEDPNPINSSEPSYLLEYTNSFLKQFDNVVFYSESSYLRYRNYFKISNNLIMNNAADIDVYNSRIYPSKKSKYNVGILGHIEAEHKGKSLAEQIFNLFFADCRLIFKVFGNYNPGIIHNCIAFGIYKEEEIFYLLKREQIDFFIFVSRFAETYSYCLSKALKTGLPIIYNNIGSYKDRLRNYENCYYFEEININKIIDHVDDIINKSSITNNENEYSTSVIKNIPEFYPYLVNKWNLDVIKIHLHNKRVCFIYTTRETFDLFLNQIQLIRSTEFYNIIDYIFVSYSGKLKYFPQDYKIKLVDVNNQYYDIISYFSCSVNCNVIILSYYLRITTTEQIRYSLILKDYNCIKDSSKLTLKYLIKLYFISQVIIK